MSISPTEAAIKAAGRSLSEVARRFEFKSTQSVANWIINNQVPSERVLQLCEFGGWLITPHQLRPDIYPNPSDGLPDNKHQITTSVS
ncbi:YdaS family helix-turn-helix protein [Citrobacter koseri]|uniref:YdaS family helix-turn-helix protein n=1 Tax=Citrobacter koseri TaxID=545 RepID=UPI001A3387AD|nr:YdaS family helix-turn-helix protein [Citrobacter koseri]ELO4689981.1 helix-turn-helix domain-containing protein [Citrobacter koseri]MEB2702217.1 YdaS family helix-turn-helix protein [Citrobacter koseri]MEB2708637.1 YdaS family helix-turn-helix protein [Citrobacter koseri]MEB2771099.1 YdaS family helix-turn-helix protein [Citrobacter koseri]WOJ27601.1 YdaS family helix-turn-helix protein [Citrobacter koseri]